MFFTKTLEKSSVFLFQTNSYFSSLKKGYENFRNRFKNTARRIW